MSGDDIQAATTPDAQSDCEAVPEPDPDAERRLLIDLVIYAWDRARSPGVEERLAAGLADVGVEVLRPDGEPFDPAAHEAGGVETTDDESCWNMVAETETVGFSDRGQVLREPVVVVYRPAPAVSAD